MFIRNVHATIKQTCKFSSDDFLFHKSPADIKLTTIKKLNF